MKTLTIKIEIHDMEDIPFNEDVENNIWGAMNRACETMKRQGIIPDTVSTPDIYSEVN